MTIATFCQNEKCDQDIEVEGAYNILSDVMSYTCPICKTEQEQDNWGGLQ